MKNLDYFLYGCLQWHCSRVNVVTEDYKTQARFPYHEKRNLPLQPRDPYYSPGYEAFYYYYGKRAVELG